MAFRFLKANSVAVGAFNIYIVQPDWLTRKEIIPLERSRSKRS